MIYALLSKAVKHVTQAVKKFLKMGDFNPIDGDYKYGCAFAFVDYPEFKTSTIQTIFTKYRQKYIYEGKRQICCTWETQRIFAVNNTSKFKRDKT